jgi:hypothetical protein
VRRLAPPSRNGRSFVVPVGTRYFTNRGTSNVTVGPMPSSQRRRRLAPLSNENASLKSQPTVGPPTGCVVFAKRPTCDDAEPQVLRGERTNDHKCASEERGAEPESSHKR